MDARQLILANARRLQPLQPPAMRLPRAERADIKAVALQRVDQRRIVDLGIMRDRDKAV